MISKTVLWYVSLVQDGVIVSREPLIRKVLHEMRIRTISANAAGRKYLRDNLTAVLANLPDKYVELKKKKTLPIKILK